MSSRCTTTCNRRSLLAIILLFATSLPCGANSDEKQNDLNGAWVLSGEWTGYMGLALKIGGNRYKYWFYSDLAMPTISLREDNRRVTTYTAPKPKYPLTGKVVVNGDVIELRGAGEYYDRKWRRVEYCGVTCLLAERHYQEWKKSGKLPNDRLLFRLQRFDEKQPTLNYGGFEHPDGSRSATSPCK